MKPTGAFEIVRVNAEFVTSVARWDQLPREPLQEIALVGRSNVGKSSLINTLVGKSGLAKTSNTPGRTQTLNYYRITPVDKSVKPFFFVDMPGYGFAAVNLKARSHWSDLIERYIQTHRSLSGVIQLIDLRHPPQPLDYAMSEMLHNQDHPRLIVGTKADKVPKTKISGTLLKIAESLNIDSREVIAFSSETGTGRDQLWRWIAETVRTSSLM